MTRLKSLTFDSGHPGPSCLITGGVHGSEPCGSVAINCWISRFESGEKKLNSGRVTYLPNANPPASAKGTRLINENLNRIIARYDSKTLDNAPYEFALADQIAGLIEDHDYLIDLHSFSTPSAPFVFQDSNRPACAAFADHLGIENILVGWDDYFGENSFSSLQSYALSQDKIPATVECGVHDDPQSIEVADRVIGYALNYLKLIDFKPLSDIDPKRFKLSGHAVEFAPGEYTKKWRGFDPISKGTEIARYESGELIIADHDCVIIMPSKNDNSGDNWFYWAREIA